MEELGPHDGSARLGGIETNPTYACASRSPRAPRRETAVEGGMTTTAMTLGRDGMLLVLAWAAGIMDAVAYLGLGVFTTMMTGNTALLALAIGRGELAPVARAGLALAAFSAGAAIGALIAGRRRSRGEWPSVVTEALACEAMLLGVLTIVWHVAGRAPATG